jgi:glycerol uptake facilitator-like aquaporin
MFAVPVLAASHTRRGGAPVLLSEVVATSGLLLLIVTLARTGRTEHAAWSVGTWIGAAYWFTASTSFANPAVTIGRTLTPTYAGIAPRPPQRSPSWPSPSTPSTDAGHPLARHPGWLADTKGTCRGRYP